MFKERLFTNNELIELRNALKAEGMLPVDNIAIWSNFYDEGILTTTIAFVTKTKSKRIAIASKTSAFGEQAYIQLCKHFLKRAA